MPNLPDPYSLADDDDELGWESSTEGTAAGLSLDLANDPAKPRMRDYAMRDDAIATEPYEPAPET